MKRIIIPVIVLVMASAAAFGGDVDGFERIKQKLSSAGCVDISFLSILQSEIFETTDTTDGSAVLASDGRYRVEVGPDIYLNDLEHLWSYSGDNNQVTVEKYSPEGSPSEQFVFVTRLDEYYKSSIIQPDHTYRLVKREGVRGDYPDSMIVTINADRDQIEEMKYFDINGDLNRIVITGATYLNDCEKSTFDADFPDSVEVIKL